MRLISELSRRNVLRMAVLYVVAAWLVMQVAGVLMDLGVLPQNLGPWVMAVLAIGFRLVFEVGLTLLLAFGTFTLAAIVAGHLLGGPNPADRTSLAIACASRHIGLALLIAANARAPHTLPLVVAYLVASSAITCDTVRSSQATRSLRRRSARRSSISSSRSSTSGGSEVPRKSRRSGSIISRASGCFERSSCFSNPTFPPASRRSARSTNRRRRPWKIGHW